MANDDLYSIGLDPNGGIISVPDATTPNGSIGGSDVGANAQDDQRVRDLIQQYLTDSTTIDVLYNALNIANIGGVPKLLGGWHNTNSTDILVNADNPGTTTYPDPMNNAKSITLLGNPILIQYKAQYYVFYTNTADPSWDIVSYMMLDSEFVGFSEVTMDDEVDAAVARGQTRRFSVMGQCVLKPGVAVNSLGTTAGAMTTVLAAGAHTFQLDVQIRVGNVAAGTLDFSLVDESVMVYDLGADDLVTVT